MSKEISPVCSDEEALILGTDNSDIEIQEEKIEDDEVELVEKLKKTSIRDKLDACILDSVKASKDYLKKVEKAQQQKRRKTKPSRKMDHKNEKIPRVKQNDPIRKRKSVVVVATPKPTPKVRMTSTKVSIAWMMKKELPNVKSREVSLKGKSLVVKINNEAPQLNVVESSQPSSSRRCRNDPKVNTLTNRYRIYKPDGTSVVVCYDCGQPGHVTKFCPRAMKIRQAKTFPCLSCGSWTDHHPLCLDCQFPK